MYSSPVTIEALLVLDAIESRGSFASAAEQLNKVPSALSYIVQKLEEQLSVTLFIRQGRRSVLTSAGRHLLDEGRKVLAAVSKITEQTQTISYGWEPKIRIAFDSIYEIQQLFSPLTQFLSEHPKIELDLSEEVMNGSWESLREDRIDLLVGAPAPVPNHQGIRSKKIGQFKQVFVVPKGHELSWMNKPISKSNISDYRTIIVHDTAQKDIPRSSNIIEKSQHFFVNSIEHKIQAIIAGLGIGYLPKQRIRSFIRDGSLVEIEIEDAPKTTDQFIAWKIANKGKGLRRLRDIILQHQNQQG